MTTEAIRTKLENKGYRVSRDINSGKVVVTPKSGFAKSFDSLNAAYNYYFN